VRLALQSSKVRKIVCICIFRWRGPSRQTDTVRPVRLNVAGERPRGKTYCTVKLYLSMTIPPLAATSVFSSSKRTPARLRGQLKLAEVDVTLTLLQPVACPSILIIRVAGKPVPVTTMRTVVFLNPVRGLTPVTAGPWTVTVRC